MSLVIKKSERGTALAIQVLPRASKNEVAGVQGNAIKIRLTAPPVEGAANAALIAFLADALGVAKGRIEIVAGETSRRKLVTILGVTPAEVERRLLGPVA